MEARQLRLDANGLTLSVLELGPRDAPPLIMLHGMRDVAWSLAPVAEPLARRFRVLLPELRGHGDSDRADGYLMDQFVFDLHRVVETLVPDPAVLLGHSLGGHVVSRFAALFPERVRAAIVVEGLGPPARPGEGDPAADLARHREHLLQVLSIPPVQRALEDLGHAARRLIANNPRLDPARARELAERATREGGDGGRQWAFDARVASVFLGLSREDSERFWRQVRCPTLIVSGTLAHEYWRSQMAIEWDGRFAPGELDTRVRCFPDAEHRLIDGAGHMVHYDRPEALVEVIDDFLERRL